MKKAKQKKMKQMKRKSAKGAEKAARMKQMNAQMQGNPPPADTQYRPGVQNDDMSA